MSSLPLDNLPLFKAPDAPPVQSAPPESGAQQGDDFHEHLQRAAGDEVQESTPANAPSTGETKSEKPKDPAGVQDESDAQQSAVESTTAAETRTDAESESSQQQPTSQVATSLPLAELPGSEPVVVIGAETSASEAESTAAPTTQQARSPVTRHPWRAE